MTDFVFEDHGYDASLFDGGNTTIEQNPPPLPIHGDPDVLYDDRNGDGVADTMYRDVDHDGRIDDIYYIGLEPGELTVVHTETGAFGEEPDGLGDAIDLDGDGDMDKVVLEPADGRSLVLVDTDGDHVADRKYHTGTALHDR